MIKRNQKLIRALNYLSDAVILFLSYFFAVYLKYIVVDGRTMVWQASPVFLASLAVFCLLMPLVYYHFRVYGQSRFRDEIGEYVTIAFTNLFGVLIIAAIFYVFRVTEFSREALALFWLISSFLVIAKHFIGRRLVSHFRVLGYNQQHVIIVGNGSHALGYVHDLRQEKRLGIDVLGYVSAAEKQGLGKRLGSYEELAQIIEEYSPDELIIALEPHELQYMADVLSAAGKEGVHVSLIPFYNDYIPPHPQIDCFGNTKLIDLRATPMDSVLGAVSKRVVDIVASLIMLVLLSPLMFFTALGVKLSSPGPVFFRQQRVGRDKKIFSMLKFRSMRVNAEENTAWSTNADPRKTKFGSFIRKFSIDELPQLFNVLKGDMSLVGPRPEIPFYVSQFKETVPFYLVRQQVRPGMTGWAQVHGLRGDTSIEERVKYDIWYIQNWSLWLDLKILFMTVFKGAFKNEEKLV